ncbi:hypothetical protein [Paraflavitalea speifideaquila]|uniref:hypothetical protein n=1 Tax=Paraflavitalea speifideaquila TaxID=3076558 RepID=UPI0028E2040C|nr:hypothetical protein [Paraflavitalea speifideiaquila]
MPDSLVWSGGGEIVDAKVTTRQQDGAYRWYTLVMKGKDILTQSFVLPAYVWKFKDQKTRYLSFMKMNLLRIYIIQEHWWKIVLKENGR